MANLQDSPIAPSELTRTVAEEVRDNFRKAEVFKKYGIDFCCGGKKTLSAACQEKNIDPALLLNDLAAYEGLQGNASQNYKLWDPGFLADYIVNTHHQYVKSAIPVLTEFTQKISRVHGGTHPELVEIERLFSEVAEELTAHMYKEEEILFPFIRQITGTYPDSGSNKFRPFRSAEQPIRMMEMEHETAGFILKTIRELSNAYTVPEGACNSYRMTFAKLKEFEEDLHQHIHLENNILFPKCLELEAKAGN